MKFVDEFQQQLLPAEFGGLPLTILRTDDNFGRGLVKHTHPNVDGALLRDTGAEPRTTSVTLAFLPPLCIQGVTNFLNVAATGEPQRFVHPWYGSYLAMPENIGVRATAEDRDYITIEVTFVEHRSDIVFTDLATELAADIGVHGAAADLDQALSDAGVTSTVGADAVAQAEAWQEADSVDSRQVNLETNAVTDSIANESARLELSSSIDYYPLLVSFERLHNKMRALATYLISTAPKLTVYTVPVAQPLLAIAQAIYGGTLALDMHVKLLTLNDLRNPARIEAGTELVVEVAASG